MSTARQSAEIRAYLQQLAQMLEQGWASPAATAKALRDLADHALVSLPGIDPSRDNLQHWTDLSDHRLRCEVSADAWSLAAGVYVQADRATRGALDGAP